MIVIVSWPDWSVRQDRCVMFSQTAEWSEATYLITSARLPDYLQERLHPKSQIVYAPDTARGFRFFTAASEIAEAVVADFPSSSRIIFQELTIPRVALYAQLRRWLPRASYRSVLSFYSANATSIQNRDWRVSPERRLAWKAELSHFRVALTRFLTDMAMVRLVDVVTGNSKEICQGVIRVYKKRAKDVFLMPTAIDTDYFRPGADNRRDEGTILFLGRLYSRKGVLDLIEASYILRQRGVSFYLKMMGDNNLEADAIDRAIAQKGMAEVITIIPRQPREIVRQALQQATVLALPSYQEGSPRVVKEAMAAGCPVVVTDLPGVKPLDATEEALLFVPAGNPEILADKLAAVLRDGNLQRRMSHNGLSLVANHYSPAQVANQMFNLYAALFERNR